MKATRYFEEQVMRKRAYLTPEICEQAIRSPLRIDVQSDGRVRYWAQVNLSGDDKTRILRVITLDDGETVHNAFLDRGYREEDEER